MSIFKIKLGAFVQDRLSKADGFVIGRSQWVYGCVRYSIQPLGVEKGNPMELWGSDEDGLVTLHEDSIIDQPINFKLALDSFVRDRLTPFEGRIITRTQWAFSTNNYQVQSTLLHEGKPVQPVIFNEERLALLQAAEEKPRLTATGGPDNFYAAASR